VVFSVDGRSSDGVALSLESGFGNCFRLTAFGLFLICMSSRCIYSSQGGSEKRGRVSSPAAGNELHWLDEGSKKLFGCPAGLSGVCCCCM
jgi:hypothetical protein